METPFAGGSVGQRHTSARKNRHPRSDPGPIRKARMHLISDQQERIRVLGLGGDIDFHFAPVLRTLLEEKTKVPSEALVLDLSKATFIDSTGIAVIIEHLRSASRKASIFCIGGMSAAVKEVFEVICLRKVMPVFETKEEALEAIEQKRIGGPESPIFAAAD